MSGYIACEQALHLGELREVTREQHAKGDVLSRLALLIKGELASRLAATSDLLFSSELEVRVAYVSGHENHHPDRIKVEASKYKIRETIFSLSSAWPLSSRPFFARPLTSDRN